MNGERFGLERGVKHPEVRKGGETGGGSEKVKEGGSERGVKPAMVLYCP